VDTDFRKKDHAPLREHDPEKWMPVFGKKIMLRYESMLPKKPALGLDHRKSDVSDLRPF
jgi:hypothetical protein